MTRVTVPRVATDMIFGFSVFWVLIGAVAGIWPFGCESVAAVLADPAPKAAAGVVAAKTGSSGIAGFAILALVFTTLWAGNAALVRHLRRAYALPRRRGLGQRG